MTISTVRLPPSLISLLYFHRSLTTPQFFGFFSALFLAIWDVPKGLKWISYFTGRIAVPYGPLSMSWANEICGNDAEERALVLGIMNAAGYAFSTWVPLLTYPAQQAPRFKKGFIFSTCAFVAQFGVTWLVWWLQRREGRRKKEKGRQSESESEVGLLTATEL